ncbi:hypothetical protein [Hymenobacter mucosus]|uniref:Bacterial surface antigen (D15) domain-containing protein n=1 Tax=Hymenobacter mucosus TaxID=1411120 RepID=A0A238ZV45_9BACT|nr:hypothetical protein [Hymenobacter mucosus]SNR86654.1 hypothetical protein SAMN06269173_109131 [Hymenobacter mucosus]
MRAIFVAGWLSAGLLGTSTIAHGQGGATPQPEHLLNVKLNLFPIVAGGYHVSVEKMWRATSRHALMLTPQLYHGAVKALTSDLSEGAHDRVRGYGLEAQHRIYLSGRAAGAQGPYVAYGPSYQHFRMQFDAKSWAAERSPDGLSYYEYRLRRQSETIDRYGATLVVGNQFFLPELPVLFDVFLGLGVRKASSRATIPGNYYESGMSNYGSEGRYISIGFRAGVAL